MSELYINKEGTAVINVARYLMTTYVNERLKTIDFLSEEFCVSVGFIQKALTTLESTGAVKLRKQGRNGTFIEYLNYKLLVKYAGFGHVVCAMPLPYTKHYEGIASGLKQQLGQLPLYFSHMRGANSRAECLQKGTYDIAIMSKLAAMTLGSDMKVAMELGRQSYSFEHRLIYRSGEFDSIRKVGVDPSSPDQKILTEKVFSHHDIEIVEINYNNCLMYLKSGQIDAVIWLPEVFDMKENGLSEYSLDHFPECHLASEAVMVVNKTSPYITILLDRMLDNAQLLRHQQQVIIGEITPSY